MAFAKTFAVLVLGLAALESAVAKCNPKKDESCCGTPFPPSYLPPTSSPCLARGGRPCDDKVECEDRCNNGRCCVWDKDELTSCRSPDEDDDCNN